jgi:hypothetical protein
VSEVKILAAIPIKMIQKRVDLINAIGVVTNASSYQVIKETMLA